MAENADNNARELLVGDYSSPSAVQSSFISRRRARDVLREKQLRSGSKEQSLLARWWFEILAVCFSIACIACIIALLGNVHGRPYEPWHAFGTSVTPNTILAILSTLSKSSLLVAVAEALGQLKWIYFQQRAHRLFDLQIFDEASRGPLGALKLVCTVRMRALVAATGAVIVVLSMAMDPFTQQILSFPTAPTNVTNSTAEIASAQGFGLPFGDLDGTKVWPEYLLQLQETVTLGVLSNNFNSMRFNCSTGDCQWSPFRTLGVSNKCINVTSQLDIECQIVSTDESKDFHDKVCTYTFPGMNEKICPRCEHIERFKPEYHWYDETSGNLSTWHGSNGSLLMSSSGIIKQNRVTFDVQLPLIAVVEQLQWPRYPVGFEETAATFEHIGHDLLPQAVQCYITWRQHYHEASVVRRNILFDVPTSSNELRLGVSYAESADGDVGGDFGEFREKIYPLWPADRPHPSKSTLDNSNPNNEGGDIYWISTVASSVLGVCIAETVGKATENMYYVFGDFWDRTTIWNRIYQEDISTVLDRTAASITTTVRTLNQTRTIRGTVTQPVTHVNVNWYWLIYPASLVLLAALFLAASIGFSTERNSSGWKTSILPLLFCSVDEHEQRDGDASALRELEYIAKRTQAQLLKRNGEGASLQLQSPYRADS